MKYSLEPSRYFLLSIFQVWSKYVRYSWFYEGRNERTHERTHERTNERTYTTTKHITTLLLCSRVKMVKSENFMIIFIKIWTKSKNYRKFFGFHFSSSWTLIFPAYGQNKHIFFILFIFLVLCFNKICWFQS